MRKRGNRLFITIMVIIALTLATGIFYLYHNLQKTDNEAESQKPPQTLPPSNEPSTIPQQPKTHQQQQPPAQPQPQPQAPQPAQPPAPKPATTDDIKQLLSAMGATDLHNPPFSSSTPKLEMVIESSIFCAEVKDKSITVIKTECAEEDLRITSTNGEVQKMLQNQEYIVQSFQSGGSWVEIVGSKATLYLKGYLTLYKKVTGEEAPE